LLSDARHQKLFTRMAERSQIEHRYSYFQPTHVQDQLDHDHFYRRNDFPNTQSRMQFYERHALSLACQALDQLLAYVDVKEITHVLVTSCTGFYAPGLDLQIVDHYKMNPSVERSIIGFMGCYAAMNALKLSRHIVAQTPSLRSLSLILNSAPSISRKPPIWKKSYPSLFLATAAQQAWFPRNHRA
jgi:predicted naringenin-chalcone synthase